MVASTERNESQDNKTEALLIASKRTVQTELDIVENDVAACKEK